MIDNPQLLQENQDEDEEEKFPIMAHF